MRQEDDRDESSNRDKPYLTERAHPRWQINRYHLPGPARSAREIQDQYLRDLPHLDAASRQAIQVSYWFQKIMPQPPQ